MDHIAGNKNKEPATETGWVSIGFDRWLAHTNRSATKATDSPESKLNKSNTKFTHKIISGCLF